VEGYGLLAALPGVVSPVKRELSQPRKTVIHTARTNPEKKGRRHVIANLLVKPRRAQPILTCNHSRGLGQVVLRTDLDWNKEIELSQQLRMGSRRSKFGPITRFSIANHA
jgi:hypothetical protein